MSTTRLVLVRHGQSVAQVEGFFAGHDGCRGLSDLGRAQVATLRDRWASGEIGPVTALYASEMARAVETAGILAPVLGVDDVIRDCGLCELHPGDADGLTIDEAGERWGVTGSSWISEAIPNVESWVEMGPRIEAALERIAAAHEGGTVVVACHGGVIAHSLYNHLRLPPTSTDGAWFVATNASVTEWVLDPSIDDWRTGRWGLLRYNDHAHTTMAGLLGSD